MCGIVSTISTAKININDALNAIAHRGPDAQQIFNDTLHNHFISLGHVRLSILDLKESANQPFISTCKNYILSFNGEIYNYKELRTKLEQAGCCFKTSSDTEVLLQAYIHWGKMAFNQFDGMFAFTILDKTTSEFIVARDHLGIKPIYYSFDPKTNDLFVASEIKAFNTLGVKPKVDPAMIYEFLLNNFLYEPDTGFKNIKKVFPGAYIVYDFKTNNINETIYFDSLDKPHSIKNKQSSTIEDIVKHDIAIQLRSDVPLGIFFSGGNDSSLIASIATQYDKDIHCITSKYSKSEITTGGLIDDYPYAKKIAALAGLNLESINFNFSKFGHDLERIVTHLAKVNEELNGDFTCLSSELISEQAQKAGYKVMLSGMGADELYAGYPRYFILRYFRFFKMLSCLLSPFKTLLKKSPRLAKKVDRFFSFFRNHSNSSFILSYSHLIGFFSQSELQNMVKDHHLCQVIATKYEKLDHKISDMTPLKKSIYLDLYGFLSHNFIVADKSSMAHSIELRVPLATSHAICHTLSLTDRQLIRGLKTKYPIKSLLYRFLPKKLVNRKKTGFNPPLDQLLLSIQPQRLLSLLNKNLSGILNMSMINIMIKEHFSGKKNRTYQLLQLLYLAKWLDIYD